MIAEVLANGGFLPQLAELNNKNRIFTKKNGVVFGIMWFILFSMLFTALMGIANAPEEPIAVSAVIGFFGMLLLVIGSLVFLPSSKKPGIAFQPLHVPRQPATPDASRRAAPHTALPPQQSIPVSAYAPPRAGRWRETNDLQPTSVTEETTRLLDDDKN
ncbi:MAG: hypothetical protein ACK4S4_09650 [Pyrinomonadaceae bacterium]